MIAFPNAKINIGLNILSKREDGYHNLSSCFLPIGWKDGLEVIPSDVFEFQTSGISIPGEMDSNLCVKAYHLLKTKHDIPPVKMHLHKVIPMGAGLGGGSSDGAFALKLLNDLFEIGLTKAQLESHAATLGADCPFFIDNQPKLVTGIGELMKPVDLEIENYSLVVVFPGSHVSTKTAFSGISPKTPNYDLSTIVCQSPGEWKDVITNDFEKTVFAAHPEILAIKHELLSMGAAYASMTGTGSAVYGWFDQKIARSVLEDKFKDCLVWKD